MGKKRLVEHLVHESDEMVCALLLTVDVKGRLQISCASIPGLESLGVNLITKVSNAAMNPIDPETLETKNKLPI